MSETKKPKLSEIQAREQVATEGPWNVCQKHDYEVLKGDCRPCECGENYITDAVVDAQNKKRVYTTQTKDDSLFIAHSRTDIPHLLDLVERLGKALEHLLSQSEICEFNNAAGSATCETCFQVGDTIASIPHKPDCAVKEARALLKEIKQ